MKTSHKTRAIALVVSIVLTFGAVELMAEYAYPAAQPTQLASAAH
jgi:hypothetical protein